MSVPACRPHKVIQGHHSAWVRRSTRPPPIAGEGPVTADGARQMQWGGGGSRGDGWELGSCHCPSRPPHVGPGAAPSLRGGWPGPPGRSPTAWNGTAAQIRSSRRYLPSVLTMTSFAGHTVPGSIFLLWGVWQAVINAVKLFNRKPTTYTPKLLLSQRVENVACATTAFIGLLIQQFALDGPGLHLYNEKTHQWVALKRWHHSTIYLFFLVSSLGGILTQCLFRLPLGLDHLLLSIALFNEGMIFISHNLIAPTLLEQNLHSLLLIPIFSAAVCLLVEVHFRDHPILALFRTSMFLTQGTWFWQIAFVLYPPWERTIWDQNDPETTMFLAICFSWHYLAIIFLISIIYGIVHCLLKKKRKYESTHIEIEPLIQDSRAYLVVPDECAED
uniref:transmembrane protein 45B-like n=1 Tax=Euleptes europaea TaxID=460621 RepID=UPI00253F6C23|nr:transmembrane protein 45B-like [Euleptes europaea]